MTNDYILETHDLCKRYPGQLVLKNINLKIKAGSVHALVGENGAGKSTFVNSISGSTPITEGYFKFEGQKVEQLTPHEAQVLGIRVVHQELNLISELSVAENLFLGNEIVNKFGQIDWKKTYEKARKILADFGVRFNEKTKISALSVAEQEMVEIIKAVSSDARLIFMDEPSAVFTEEETKKLFKIIKRLKNNGITIIYISHKIDELFEVCDTISILRDGQHIHSGPINDLTSDQIIEMMVAHEVSEQYPYIPAKTHETILEIKNYSRAPHVENISFSVNKGEVFGIYGLVGAGRTELARLLVGADPISSGEMFIEGKQIRISNPSLAIKEGLAYITESRREFGLHLDMSIRMNSTIASLERYLDKFNQVDKKSEKQYVNEKIQEMGIVTDSDLKLAGQLSGGNQQKVLIARFLLTQPKILILDEPTRGVDVGAKVSIYRLLNELKSNGMSIIAISSELPEVMGISDRIMVMHDGHNMGVFDRKDFSEENIGQAAFGKEVVK
ncbi:MAG: sugar ABC transporter ATP-binding protein [Fastidiosipilaceae bacterium]